jgi:glutamate N-acetyltransferase/amino-acid N-acetyltransferase
MIRSTEPGLIHFAYLLAPTGDPAKPRFVVDADVLELRAKEARGEKLGPHEEISHFDQEYPVDEIPLLQRALLEVVDDTFNAITVDGDTSTNDTVVLMANGASGATITEAEYAPFVTALRTVCLELALGIVRGGEGATKLVTVNVTGAASKADARATAKAIATSLLVKTAIHGGDPNWGRLLAVAGRAGVAFDPQRAKVTIGSIVLFEDGRPYDDRAPQAAEHLKATDITVGVNLGAGSASSTMWTCDLSAEYVKINADYRT